MYYFFVLPFFRSLAGSLFYLVGGSFFIAYVLLKNNIYPLHAAWWMQVADLPFAATALLYGGLSLYQSLAGSRASRVLPFVIGVTLVLLFVFLVFLNFWQAIPAA